MGLHPSFLPPKILSKISVEERRPFGKATMTHEEITASNDYKYERQLHNNIIAYFERNRIPYLHQPMHKKTHGVPGWPDFTFVFDGQTRHIECKSLTGELSDSQEQLHADFYRHNVKVKIIRSYQEFFTWARSIGM